MCVCMCVCAVYMRIDVPQHAHRGRRTTRGSFSLLSVNSENQAQAIRLVRQILLPIKTSHQLLNSGKMTCGIYKRGFYSPKVTFVSLFIVVTECMSHHVSPYFIF